MDPNKTLFTEHLTRFYGVDLPLNLEEDPEIEHLLNLVDHLIHERYRDSRAPLLAKIPFIHPHLIPESIRRVVSGILKRGGSTSTKNASAFPRFPGDCTVDIIRKWVLDSCASGAATVPFWPTEKRFAVTLSHDVDSDFIFRNPRMLEEFLKIEEGLGFRSAWYFVTHRFKIDEGVLRELQSRGHEIGFHGDTHDYRLPYLKEPQMRTRLERCRTFFRQFGVTGGRSPVFLRTPLFMTVLQDYLDYDTSFHDSTIGSFTGKPEGSCTFFPFFIGTLLELPTTVPEEFFLEQKGFSRDESLEIQIAKIETIQRAGGLAHILTHPEPGISANPRGLGLYQSLLETCAKQIDAWNALPQEVNAHWRARDEKIRSTHHRG